jgi:hypothetical protein
MPNIEVIYDAGNEAAADMGENYGARLGVRPWPVSSIEELRSDLSGARQNGVKIDRLYFVTHGGAGWIGFGKDLLTVHAMRNELAGKGFEELFNPGAQVHFDGCEVAEMAKGCEDWVPDPASLKCTVGGNGELFLLTFAQIFLIKAGGSASAWTSKGFGFPVLGGDVIHHLTGQHIYLYMRRGGSRWRFAVGRKVVPSKNQWWKVWSRGDQGKEEVYYYQFHPPSVYWFSEKQYLGRSENDPSRDPGMVGQGGRWATDKEWLSINWLDKNGVPYAGEQWDMPLFDEYQTGIALDPYLGEHELRATMLGYYA